MIENNSIADYGEMENCPSIKVTFLGAHAFPSEFKENHQM